jgi:hypothetical protein|tara:strand:+ start:221 stop:490 length:270 start_codon:yes stop_codon:yes gene_type:complete
MSQIQELEGLYCQESNIDKTENMTSKSIIYKVKVYNSEGILQKVISQKALLKRSDKLFLEPYLFDKDKRGQKRESKKKNLIIPSVTPVN